MAGFKQMRGFAPLKGAQSNLGKGPKSRKLQTGIHGEKKPKQKKKKRSGSMTYQMGPLASSEVERIVKNQNRMAVLQAIRETYTQQADQKIWGNSLATAITRDRQMALQKLAAWWTS